MIYITAKEIRQECGIIHHFSMKLYSNRRTILKNTEGLLKSTKK